MHQIWRTEFIIMVKCSYWPHVKPNTAKYEQSIWHIDMYHNYRVHGKINFHIIYRNPLTKLNYVSHKWLSFKVVIWWGCIIQKRQFNINYIKRENYNINLFKHFYVFMPLDLVLSSVNHLCGFRIYDKSFTYQKIYHLTRQSNHHLYDVGM